MDLQVQERVQLQGASEINIELYQLAPLGNTTGSRLERYWFPANSTKHLRRLVHFESAG